MSDNIKIIKTKDLSDADKKQIYDLCKQYNNEFVPPLSYRENIDSFSVIDVEDIINYDPIYYVDNLLEVQDFIIVCRKADKIIGFLSAVNNSNNSIVKYPFTCTTFNYFVPIILVNKTYRNKGIAKKLCIWLISYTNGIPIVVEADTKNKYMHILLKNLDFECVKTIYDAKGKGITSSYYFLCTD